MNKDYLCAQQQKYKNIVDSTQKDQVLTNAGVHINVINYKQISTDADGLYVLSPEQRVMVLEALQQKEYRME